MKTRPLMALMAATTFALPLAAALPAAAQDVPVARASVAAPVLNLSAFGEVKAMPDMATITTGVQTEAATAVEAMAANRTRMTQVIATLRRAGVAERDIQTSGLNLNAVYDYQENQPPRLRGYQVSNVVTVTVRDLERLGMIADAVVSSGANQINGIAFGLSDPSAAENAARREAVAALRAKAELYAQATGLRLAGLTTLSESGGYSPRPPMPMYAMRAAAADSTPVAAGELSVRIDIQATYELAR